MMLISTLSEKRNNYKGKSVHNKFLFSPKQEYALTRIFTLGKATPLNPGQIARCIWGSKLVFHIRLVK